eukprot:TRINITY_DN5529_c0_g3_i1.p1 TRINITY_DN5529_c0_g3~~TRINITY_DN5529_c0_g3_i1.p1  ORF type:complete len:709 (+),score=140.99 TRINITY_DN5529_c0_g3_i1:125-2251(+)
MDAKFGSTNTDVISRLPVYLDSSLPRLARVGDVFNAGVTVTVTDSTLTANVTITVYRVCQLLNITDTPLTMTLPVSGVGRQVALFQFTAVAQGKGYLFFDLKVGNRRVDSLLDFIPIEGRQEPVTIATAMSVSAEHPVTQAISLPPAERGTGNVTIDAGVGHLPAIVRIADAHQLGEQWNAYDWLQTMIPAAVISKVYGKVGKQVVREHEFDWYYGLAISMLQSRFLNFDGLIYSPDFYTGKVDLHLNAFGIYVCNLANKNLGTDLSGLLPAMRMALKRGVQELLWNLKQDEKPSADFLADLYFYSGINSDLADYFNGTLASLDILRQRKDELGLQGAAKLALALQSSDLMKDKAIQKLVADLITRLMNSIRIQGPTAYLNSDGSGNADFLTTAIGLQVLVRNKTSEMNIVQALASFIAAEQSWMGVNFGPEESVQFMIALSELDKMSGSAKPSLTVSVLSGDQRLMLVQFDPKKSLQMIAHSSFYYESLRNSTNIICKAKPLSKTSGPAIGEVLIVLGATFVPAEVSPTSIDRGISVEKIVQLVNPQTGMAGGPNIQVARRGDRVQVSIQLQLKDDLNQVEVVEPLSSCYEVIENTYCGAYFWGNPFRTENRPDKMIFRSGFTPLGVYNLCYQAVITVEGNCLVPPVQAAVPTHPEINGISGSNYLLTTTKKMNMKAIPTRSTCLAYKDRELDYPHLPKWIRSMLNK